MKLFKLALQIAILGLLGFTIVNYQFWLDQYALQTFRPGSELASVESRLGLTPYAKGIFYRAQPEINDKASFNRNCETSKGELELGCYYRGHIFILRIEHDSLSPEMDVVSAHELLHAVWERLSKRERDQITVQLQAVYAGIEDPELRERMANYAKTEPGQEANELHSILATEYAVLNPVLEQHYAKYFTQRSNIVAAHTSYETVFDTRRQELEQELTAIRALKAQLAVMNRQMETYRSTGQIDQYNALVPTQNRLVDQINNRIDRYRLGVEEYNALSRSLDSQEITETESGVQ